MVEVGRRAFRCGEAAQHLEAVGRLEPLVISVKLGDLHRGGRLVARLLVRCRHELWVAVARMVPRQVHHLSKVLAFIILIPSHAEDLLLFVNALATEDADVKHLRAIVQDPCTFLYPILIGSRDASGFQLHSSHYLLVLSIV